MLLDAKDKGGGGSSRSSKQQFRNDDDDEEKCNPCMPADRDRVSFP